MTDRHASPMQSRALVQNCPGAGASHGSCQSRVVVQLPRPSRIANSRRCIRAALSRVSEAATHITAFSARQNIALVIVESALAGERDVSRLTQKALQVLGISTEDRESSRS